MYSHSFLSCLSTQWFDSLIRFVDSIHWFDSLLPFIDSIHSFDSLIRFIVQVRTWTKINQQNIFLEGHFKTIGKWVQKRQTLIFTVAIFSPCVKQYCFATNSNENTRIWARLAAPVAAYSGRKTCNFLQCRYLYNWLACEKVEEAEREGGRMRSVRSRLRY